MCDDIAQTLGWSLSCHGREPCRPPHIEVRLAETDLRTYRPFLRDLRFNPPPYELESNIALITYKKKRFFVIFVIVICVLCSRSPPSSSSLPPSHLVKRRRRFQRFQHCKVSPKLPVLPTIPAGSLPSAEAGSSWDGRGQVGRTLGSPGSHRGGPTHS